MAFCVLFFITSKNKDRDECPATMGERIFFSFIVAFLLGLLAALFVGITIGLKTETRPIKSPPSEKIELAKINGNFYLEQEQGPDPDIYDFALKEGAKINVSWVNDNEVTSINETEEAPYVVITKKRARVMVPKNIWLRVPFYYSDYYSTSIQYTFYIKPGSLKIIY